MCVQRQYYEGALRILARALAAESRVISGSLDNETVTGKNTSFKNNYEDSLLIEHGQEGCGPDHDLLKILLKKGAQYIIAHPQGSGTKFCLQVYKCVWLVVVKILK